MESQDLRRRVDELRAEAASLRRRNNDHFTSLESEYGVERDRLAREQFGIEQSAESADTQAKAAQREVAKLAKQIEERETKAAAAELRGHVAEAQELLEYALGLRAAQETHEARARQATLDGAELRERAAGVERRRTKLHVEREDLAKQALAVEQEIDKLDQQADLLEQASGQRTEGEAEALLAKAAAITVDRTVINAVIPESFDG